LPSPSYPVSRLIADSDLPARSGSNLSGRGQQRFSKLGCIFCNFDSNFSFPALKSILVQIVAIDVKHVSPDAVDMQGFADADAVTKVNARRKYE
jgi:hypothetical protein